MSRFLINAIAGILAISCAAAAFGQTPSGGNSVSQPASVDRHEKSRADVRAEIKANRQTAAEHERQVVESVTGLTPASRTTPSPSSSTSP